MLPLDTDHGAYAAQLEAWRRMGPQGRFALVARLSSDLRELSRAGIRQRHPLWTDLQVEMELRRLMWGDELFGKVYPEQQVSAP
jgi:hypothetical protein